MRISNFTSYSIFGLAALPLINFPDCIEKVPDELPNILWIVSEDNSAHLMGCYGNSFATTPNIDRLADEGFLYSHAYATCPVCGPARNSLITGVYAASNGHENMRSAHPKSDKVRTYPEYLRDAGYYCTNNAKTDYNYFSGDDQDEWLAIWDESSNEAHYRNRADGHPFFAIFNRGVSHEASIHRHVPAEDLRHDPKKVPLPTYHPDLPEIRHAWAQYYDRIEDMDTQVGELLRELEESGEADNTIVMYFSDHGGVLLRSKTFLYETGTHVPFIIRIPEKYKYLFPPEKPGQKVDRLVNFVDFAPTLLSIADIPIPDYMQGDAFLGKQKTKDPEYTYMTTQRDDERYDLARSVRDKQYRYIRNYMPRKYIPHKEYVFTALSAQAWRDAFNRGETDYLQSKYFNTKPIEELYNVVNDPWEVNNLASDPAHAAVLERMRKAETDWRREIRDVGLIPESEYGTFAGEKSMYDYMRSSTCPFDELINASNLATFGGVKDLNTFVDYLNNDHSGIRYWGAMGLLFLGDKALPAVKDLKKILKDESASVVTVAAEALYNLGMRDEAENALLKVLKSQNKYARGYALNTIDYLEMESSSELVEVVVNMIKNTEMSRENFWIYLAVAKWLFEKWELNADDYNIEWYY